jgi:NADPH-dependent curcumin reductase CurA
MSTSSRAWHLLRRPAGEPVPSDFGLLALKLPEPEPGQVLIRNDWFSVDPYMRGRMNEGESYIPQFELGHPMDGWSVGTVVASRAESVPTGSVVLHFLGWREHALAKAADVQIIDTDLAPAQAYLGVLGATGLTAYAALTEIAPVRPGEVVFISGAAGAVGSIAGQLARRLGAAKIIGSAGGPVKAQHLVENFGFDVGLDYREGDLPGQLAKAAPEGVDVYFDNVGGEHLQAALGAMNRYGRIALCGAISVYNDVEPTPGPDNLVLAIGKRLTLRGMNVGDHEHLAKNFIGQAAAWLREGSLRADETVVDGIENALDGFLGMMRGAGTGKTMIRVAQA